MTRRKKVVEKEVVETQKEVETTVETLDTFIYGCFPVGYIMPENEEIE